MRMHALRKTSLSGRSGGWTQSSPLGYHRCRGQGGGAVSKGDALNTEYLREFVVFAGYMNFTTAAKALDMSQPTLSRHISELERHYRCELVDRAAVPLRLTYCGRTLLEHAPKLVALENTLDELMGEARREPYDNLVIQRYRKSPMVHRLLSDAVNATKLAHPGFTFTRRPLNPGDDPGHAVLCGDLDVGIVSCTTDGEPICPVDSRRGLGVFELAGYSEGIRFAVARTSPLALREGLSLAELAESCFVFPYNPEFGRCLPDVERLFEARGLKLRFRRHELNDVEELGLMGIGPNDVFIVVESAAQSPDAFYLRNPDLVIVPCAEPIRVTRYLVYRDGDESPALRAFLEKLGELV